MLRVTSTAICGSDLHLYTNAMPGMKVGEGIGEGISHAGVQRLVRCGWGAAQLLWGPCMQLGQECTCVEQPSSRHSHAFF